MSPRILAALRDDFLLALAIDWYHRDPRGFLRGVLGAVAAVLVGWALLVIVIGGAS